MPSRFEASFGSAAACKDDEPCSWLEATGWNKPALAWEGASHSESLIEACSYGSSAICEGESHPESSLTCNGSSAGSGTYGDEDSHLASSESNATIGSNDAWSLCAGSWSWLGVLMLAM
jgi:hypothetical protein